MRLDRPAQIRSEIRPKPGGGARRLVRLGPTSDADYRRVVVRSAARIERSLGPGVFANRADTAGGVRPWRPARLAWRHAVLRAIAHEGAHAAMAVGDVRACFPSIGDGALHRAGLADDDLLRLLGTFREGGVRGLPVGPEPSAILANAVLAIADRAMLAAVGHHPIRWVDDVILVTAGRREAIRALDAWRRALAELGLEPNEDKTRILEDAREGGKLILGRAPSAAQRAERGIIGWP